MRTTTCAVLASPTTHTCPTVGGAYLRPFRLSGLRSRLYDDPDPHRQKSTSAALLTIANPRFQEIVSR